MSVETPAQRDAALAAFMSTTGAAIEDDLDKAGALFRATGSSGEGVLARIRVGRHTVVVDEPAGLGGDAAPNPVEHALVALLSSQVVTYRFWAVKLGIPLDDIDIAVEGDMDLRGFLGLDDAVPPGFGEVRVSVTLTGPAGEERYRELAAAVQAHCPVLDLLRTPTQVTTRLT